MAVIIQYAFPRESVLGRTDLRADRSSSEECDCRGGLEGGQPLPSVRKLAASLGINPTTAARAYQNLERDGVITTIPGGGTYVAENVPRFLKSEKLRRLQPYARQIAVEGTQLRLTDEEILKTVQDELDSLGERK